MSTTIHEAAEAAIRAGLSVIPVDPDTKRPLGAWAQWQQERPKDAGHINGARAIGLVGGIVSGGLMCIDIDAKYDLTGKLIDDYTKFIEALAPGLIDKLLQQWTHGKGLHLIYRTAKPLKSMKLAERPATEEELSKKPEHKEYTLIETKGEGGQFLIAPSPGYELIGEITDIKTISEDEQEILLNAARSFNQVKDNRSEYKTKDGGEIAFDDFNRSADVPAIMERNGWKVCGNRGDTVYFSRPGKVRGISASWNHIPGRLYVFTSSSEFDARHVYTPFAIIAILEYGGDFKAAARSLRAQGYGSKPQGANVQSEGVKLITGRTAAIESEAKASICRVNDFIERIDALHTEGYKRGLSTGWQVLDTFYTIVKGHLNIVTGIPGHGKSEFIDNLAVNLARLQNWKFAIFSPENYPFEIHFQKLAEKYINKAFFGPSGFTKEDIQKAKEFINEHFFFLALGDDGATVDALLNAVGQVKVDGFILDPWNECEHMRPMSMNESEYIGYTLMKVRRFSRMHDIATWIIAHPTKLKKDKETKKYDPPDLYDISGSAAWFNKADNGLVVFRHDEQTEIIIEKIKYRFYGKKGSAFLRFKSLSGIFEEVHEADNW
jgi:hypothetical protein